MRPSGPQSSPDDAPPRLSYLLGLLPGVLLPQAWAIGWFLDLWWLAAAWVPLIYFVVIPLGDHLLGRDMHRVAPADERRLAADRWYRVLLWACLPLQGLNLLGSAWVVSQSWLTLPQALLWTLSTGLVGGVLAINTAHELIHRTNRLDPLLGGVLLSTVAWSGFKIEHIHGHHVWVGTDADGSSAQRGETVYRFIALALWHNPQRAWTLARAREQRLGRPWNPWRHELMGWTVLTLAWLLACVMLLGWVGVGFFLLQALVAVSLLEVVNYLEHYGLRRRVDATGKPERVNHAHSWNASAWLSHRLLFGLPRHADHHAFAARPYMLLRHHDDSPQLPAGYAAMIVLALLPPLWFRVMDRRLDAWQR